MLKLGKSGYFSRLVYHVKVIISRLVTAHVKAKTALADGFEKLEADIIHHIIERFLFFHWLRSISYWSSKRFARLTWWTK